MAAPPARPASAIPAVPRPLPPCTNGAEALLAEQQQWTGTRRWHGGLGRSPAGRALLISAGRREEQRLLRRFPAVPLGASGWAGPRVFALRNVWQNVRGAVAASIRGKPELPCHATAIAERFVRGFSPLDLLSTPAFFIEKRRLFLVKLHEVVTKWCLQLFCSFKMTGFTQET